MILSQGGGENLLKSAFSSKRFLKKGFHVALRANKDHLLGDRESISNKKNLYKDVHAIWKENAGKWRPLETKSSLMNILRI